MRFQRLIILVCLLFSPLLAVAQYDRVAIDSMNTAIREYRHSVRQEIRDYRDSIHNTLKSKHVYKIILYFWFLRIGN